ncbi:hypothetical protein [Streptomyces sp. enrichment culture]|uniref:hypothetical protein n=1 Tax=Streptomyces sp. enrichment culture TaxID=1795815 RepID=UPI003F56772B
MTAAVLVRRALTGATALRGGRSWRPTPYQLAGLLCWAGLSLAFWAVPLCCDAGLHAAAVERLRDDLLHPRHPTADLPGAGSPAYSPLSLAQAVAAQLTGLGGREVLRPAGPLHLLVLIVGLGRFVRMLTPRRWAPVLALVAVTALWGAEGAGWSDGPGLLPPAATLAYPSVLAVGLTFWAWALTGARARDADPVRHVGPSGLRGPSGWAALGLLYGLILLVHPGTAVAAGLGAVALVAAGQRGWRPAVAARWALTVGVALSAAAVWPYFDVFDPAVWRGAGGEQRHLYRGLAGVFWPVLPALPALWLRVRRGGPRDPLVLMAVLGAAVAAYGWTDGRPACARALGLAVVASLCALAVELAAPRPWPAGRRVLGGAAAAGFCVGLLTVHAGAVVPRALDPVGAVRPPRWPDYTWAARYIGRGEVVVADGPRAALTLPGYGANLAAPAVPDPALDERERQRRLAEVRVVLDPGSAREERAAVVRRLGVRWLLLSPGTPAPPEAVVVTWSHRTGEVLARVGG